MGEERREIVLTRDLRRTDGHYGTFGDLDTGTFRCKILERPKPGLVGDHPCVPPTDRGYDMDWTSGVHPHHPQSYEVRVPGRTAILFHSANWYQQLLGCFAPGLIIDDVIDLKGKCLGSAGAKQVGVSGSLAALDGLIKNLAQKPCRLVIKELTP